jgi:hypothetical protein
MAGVQGDGGVSGILLQDAHKLAKLVVLCLSLSASVSELAAQTPNGLIARCGASSGTAYYFSDPLLNPEGPQWVEDGLSNGQIILTSIDGEWDIKFSDVRGGNSYREDGAVVIKVGENKGKLNIVAAHPNYVDTYTFNLFDREVVWTSHKLGPLPPKVAIYRAECE